MIVLCVNKHNIWSCMLVLSSIKFNNLFIEVFVLDLSAQNRTENENITHCLLNQQIKIIFVFKKVNIFSSVDLYY